MKPLNPQEQLFVDAYLNNGHNGTNAAITAGYAKVSARVQASKLIKRENIAAAIAGHHKQIIKSVKGSATWKRKKLIKIADYLSKDIDAKTAKAVISAIAELNKMDGHYSAEKVVNTNLNVDTDLQKVSEESNKAQAILDKYRSKY
jgi:phage terminase small subunit